MLTGRISLIYGLFQIGNDPWLSAWAWWGTLYSSTQENLLIYADTPGSWTIYGVRHNAMCRLISLYSHLPAGTICISCLGLADTTHSQLLGFEKKDTTIDTCGNLWSIKRFYMDCGDTADVVSGHKSGVSHHQESVDNKIILILQYAGGEWFFITHDSYMYIYFIINVFHMSYMRRSVTGYCRHLVKIL